MAKTTRARTRTRKTNGGERPKRRPRNQDLPGLEDRGIKALEDLALEYADVRDRRQALTAEEHDLKANALKLMRKHGKTLYKHEGITITVIEGEADVKVRVKKAGEQDDAEGEGGERAAIGASAADGEV